MSERATAIDIYRNGGASAVDAQAMREYAESRAGYVKYHLGRATSQNESLVCSSESAAALTEGGLPVVDRGIGPTTTGDPPRDSRYILAGRLDGPARMSVTAGASE